MISYIVTATDKDGRQQISTHETKEAAKIAASCCRGRYPWGNRVKISKEVQP